MPDIKLYQMKNISFKTQKSNKVTSYFNLWYVKKYCIYNKMWWEMQNILRGIGIISRTLDSINYIEFKEIDLTKGNKQWQTNKR